MRVTNRMMTTNMLSNINKNKVHMDSLGNQYSTQQKIQRPSEDPIIAVRSLKYKTQLSETTQYVGKNIPDAFGWMDVTESAMKEANEMLTTMNTYCNQGATGTLELNDRNSIIETLTQYRDHIYDLANADYAGRYVFTGFRTDTPLIFNDATNAKNENTHTTYTITEELTYQDIQNTTYIKNGVTYKAGTDANTYAKDAATIGTCHKLMLSYGNLDDIVIDPDPTKTTPKITLTSKDGTTKFEIPGDFQLNIPDKNATPPQNQYDPKPGEVLYIKETGELILGEAVYAKALDCPNISINYEKTKFEKVIFVQNTILNVKQHIQITQTLQIR